MQAKVGLVAAAGGVVRLCRLVGHQNGMVRLATTISSPEIITTIDYYHSSCYCDAIPNKHAITIIAITTATTTMSVTSTAIITTTHTAPTPQELVLTGRRIKAAEAKNLGICQAVVPGGNTEVLTRAKELAHAILLCSPDSVQCEDSVRTVWVRTV
jgi:enoyl-CoA hydratase/carnithine racemase